MLHWPQYCSHHSGQTRLVLQSSGTLENRKFSSLARFFCDFEAFAVPVGFKETEHQKQQECLSIVGTYICYYLSIHLCVSLSSLGPSKYPEKWRFTWDNSSTLTIVGLGLYIHTHLTSAKGLSPSCGRILKPFPAGVFYTVHPGDSQGQRRLSQIKIKDWLFDLYLVGGLEHEFYDFPFSWFNW